MKVGVVDFDGGRPQGNLPGLLSSILSLYSCISVVGDGEHMCMS